ncbi:MAG: aldehyde dehydrogenase family protein [Pirellulaceae bacterium]|nr:aldehyde dehydrogenase family protein [Pirellulaceae bacterium]
MTITSVNPATNETVESITPLTRRETLDAVAKAHEAYQSLRTTSFDDRKQII